MFSDTRSKPQGCGSEGVGDEAEAGGGGAGRVVPLNVGLRSNRCSLSCKIVNYNQYKESFAFAL